MKWNGSEKRRFIRAEYPCKIILVTPSEHTIITHTENIGAGGVRVVIDEKLDILSTLLIELYITAVPLVARGRVVWVVDTPVEAIDETERYDTGIEFYEIKDQDRRAINDLVEELVAGKYR